MDYVQLRAHCASKQGAEETYPFDETTLVYKVMGKMFALMPASASPQETPRINLKCDPGWAQVLRQTYPAVQPGYHMNKTHWNTIICDGSIPDGEILEMIDHSYGLVVKGLTRQQRARLNWKE